jgi:hypothetical protein
LTALRFRPVATFSGLRNVPLVATSFNSLYPSLTVKPGGLTIVVVRTHDFAFDEIETIEAAWRFGHMVTIVPKEGWRTFSANFYGRPAAAKALAALRDRGAPLSAAALDWLS